MDTMFECKKCGDCCTSVHVTLKLDFFEEEMKEFMNTFTGVPMTEIRLKLNGRCSKLLSDNTCSIYDNRPLLCRKHKCKGE